MPSLEYSTEYGPPINETQTALDRANDLTIWFTGMEERGLFPLSAVYDQCRCVIVYAKYVEDD